MKRRQASPEQWNYGQISLSSRIFDTANYIFLFLLCVLMIYPLWYVLCCSFSDPALLMRHSGILLWPLDFSFAGYEKVLNYKQLWNSYVVTIFVVIAGTAMNMLFSILFAFVLSRKGMMWHKLITGLAVFTMYFSGGMIPTYLVVKSVGLYDTVWAMIIPASSAPLTASSCAQPSTAYRTRWRSPPRSTAQATCGYCSPSACR